MSVESNIFDWSTGTGATDNVPYDTHPVNGGAGEYADLAEALRDLKQVIRDQSLGVGWGTAYAANKKWRYWKGGGADFITTADWKEDGSNQPGFELKDASFPSSPAPKTQDFPVGTAFVYYDAESGSEHYVCGFVQKVRINGSGDVLFKPTGMMRYSDTSDRKEAPVGLSPVVDPATDLAVRSSFPATSFLALSIFAPDLPAKQNGNGPSVVTQDESIGDFGSIGNTPHRMQNGHFTVEASSGGWVATDCGYEGKAGVYLPVPTPDGETLQYPVFLTPVHVSGSPVVKCFLIKNITRYSHGFVVEFAQQLTAGQTITWEWMVIRDFY